MSSSVRIAPAPFWRAFLFLAAVVECFGAAPPAKPPELAQVGVPDAAEAARILGQFRRSGIPGQYYLEFELRSLPRRGEEVVYHGRYWGGRNEQGAITRVELTDPESKFRRLLVQNGEQAAVWQYAEGQLRRLGVAELFEPLIPQLEITPFDLQMPFLYWPNAAIEKITRVRGRPAYAFLFPSPLEILARDKNFTAVRGYLDTKFNALMQIDYVGTRGVLKTISLLDLKQVSEHWIPKAFDVRDEVSRDKTRFLVTAAGLNLNLPASVFDPATLARPTTPPAGLIFLGP